jgi:NADPH:quinone reductase-like Zn-dependent oxidoreductase
MGASWLGPVKQISYTTDNVDRLASFWETQVGIGPWNIFRGITLTMDYEGKPIAIPVNVGLTVHGGVLIELMQALGSGPSPFHDGLGRPIVGLQRLASVTDHIEADTNAAVARGMELFAWGQDATGQRYSYLRSAEAPGVILELLENMPSFGEFVDGLEARVAAYKKAEAAAGAAGAATQVRPGTMQAALIHDYGGAEQFRVETTAEPVPGPGQIRVKVAGAAVNPVDLKARSGVMKHYMRLEFPARLGGDVAGTVDAVGPGVTDFKVGDRVMGMINPFADGAYAEKVAFYASSFAHVPDGLDLVAAAAIPTGVMTGLQLVEKAILPRAGEKGLVTGAGGSTGRAAVMAALGAGAIVYAGVRGSSRDNVADLPVAGVIDLADDASLAAAGPFDFMADTVGGATAERLFKFVKPYGRVASVAMPPPSPPPNSTQRFSSLIVSFDRARLERFAWEAASGRYTMPVAHTLPLAKVAVAHGLMEQGGVGGKIVLIP